MFKTAYKLGDAEILATFNTEDSLTNQADAKDTDINIIMARYTQTGQLPQVTALQPLFADFTDITDYRTALETITQAKDAFLQIPAKIRAQFGNNPNAFIEYATNPENLDQMRKWGLANPAPIPNTPDTAPAANRSNNNGERSERPEDRRPDERPSTERDRPRYSRGARLPERERNDGVPEG